LTFERVTSCPTKMSSTNSICQPQTTPQQPDQLAVFCREVRNLLRSKPNCIIPFSKFVPAYHNHYGRQCCVYQFGFAKLIELLESIPHVVQIISLDNENLETSGSTANRVNHRYITLTHREQIKRFASDLIKVVKSQPGKRLKLSRFSQAYEQVLGRTFRVLDYGTNNINVLLAEIWEGTINIVPIRRELVEDSDLDGPLFVNVPLQTDELKPLNPVLKRIVASHNLVHKPYITDSYPDCWFEIPKRERSEREVMRTKYFVWDVIELLSKIKPHHSVQFSKFIPAYHYYFNRQCKVSIYGFSKLIDLFESISPEVVEIIEQGPSEEKLIRLAKSHWPSRAANTIMRPVKQSGHRSIPDRHANPKSSHQKLQSIQTRHRERPNHVHQEQIVSASQGENLSNNNNSVSRGSSSNLSSCDYSNDSAEHEPQHSRKAIDSGLTEEEMMELEDELEAYEQLEAIRNKRSTRMAAILDIFKYSIY